MVRGAAVNDYSFSYLLITLFFVSLNNSKKTYKLKY